MAAADTARLIASLELKDKFSGGIKSATSSLGGLETRLGRIGGLAKQGFGTAATNIAKLGLVAGAGLGAAIKGGLEDLATLEDATTSVDGAIQQLGLTGQITSKQVATWANEIEQSVGAAFDDKEIVAAAGQLLRFGKVAPKNLRPALEVMTDLATKTGSVDSAAALLGKALADPAKAAGKLARVGIVLTKVQQKQLKALVDSGDAAGAQAFLLDTLAKSTKGAALASQGPYQKALSTLADVSEDAKKALAEGFLPVIERVASVLSKKLGDPKVIDDIRGLGKGLADAFSKTLDAAEKIPWGSIGDAMKLAGQGAKAALDLFTGLPPWVQTAVLTGWGLNKLTGGALGGIVGELGKGLIKGVLGINAGVVNVKAGAVTGVGGAGGAVATGGKTGKIASVASAVGKVFLVGAAIGVFAELKGALDEQAAANRALVAGLPAQTRAFTGGASLAELKSSLAGVDSQIATLTAGLTPEAIAYQLDIDGVKTGIEKSRADIVAAIAVEEAKNAAKLNAQQAVRDSKLLGSTTKLDSHTLAGLAGVRNQVNAAKAATVTATGAVKAAVANVASVTRTGTHSTTSAIQAKKWQFRVDNTINTTVKVSLRETIKSTTTSKKLGNVYAQ